MISILITSAGTASAVSVIKSLRRFSELQLKIYAVDADQLAAGLQLADQHFEVSKADSPGYCQELVNICKQNGITILFAIYSKEIEVIAKNRSLLEANGIKLMLPPSDSIALCNDKVAMNDFVSSLGIKTPQLLTFEAAVESNHFPVFVKPRKSSSSANAFKVTDRDELAFLFKKYNDLIIQEFVEAPEVTVDVFCDSQSRVLVASARRRLATKSGQMTKGVTVSNKLFLPAIKKISESLKMTGVCNFQFFETSDGPVFIELNPRFAAGGLMLTVEAGANLPALVVKTLEGLPITDHELVTREGIFMTRYWEEVFIKK